MSEYDDSWRKFLSRRGRGPLFHALLESLQAGFWRCDPSSRLVTFMSHEVETMLGYSAEEWLKRPARGMQFVVPEDRALVEENFRRVVAQGEPRAIEYRARAADGHLVWIRDITYCTFEKGIPVECFGLFFDVTELRTAQQVALDFAGRLIQAQELERQRVARELHDDAGQRIALAAVELEAVRRDWESAVPELGRRLGIVWSAIEDVARTVRTVAHTLHSTHLEHLGLAAAIRGLCDEIRERTNIVVDIESLDDASCTIEAPVALTIFRVAQESLHNAVRHSRTKRIRISLTAEGDRCTLQIVDEGCGFDPAHANGDGLGLLSMRERLKSVNGKLLIRSGPGKGTLIRATVSALRRSQSAS